MQNNQSIRYIDAGNAPSEYNHNNMNSNMNNNMNNNTNSHSIGGADAVASASSNGGALLGPNDVLCGRNKHSFNNVGNRTFRIAISLNLPRYVACKTRTERSEVIHSLHRELLEMSRLKFYKRVVTTKGGGQQQPSAALIELDRTQSREKVAHALRDAASNYRGNRYGNSNSSKSKQAKQILVAGLRRQNEQANPSSWQKSTLTTGDNSSNSNKSLSRSNLYANKKHAGENALFFLRMFGAIHNERQDPKHKTACVLFNELYNKFHDNHRSDDDNENKKVAAASYKDYVPDVNNCAISKASISPSLHPYYTISSNTNNNHNHNNYLEPIPYAF